MKEDPIFVRMEHDLGEVALLVQHSILSRADHPYGCHDLSPTPIRDVPVGATLTTWPRRTNVRRIAAQCGYPAPRPATCGRSCHAYTAAKLLSLRCRDFPEASAQRRRENQGEPGRGPAISDSCLRITGHSDSQQRHVHKSDHYE
jgi:hypothetical protein